MISLRKKKPLRAAFLHSLGFGNQQNHAFVQIKVPIDERVAEPLAERSLGPAAVMQEVYQNASPDNEQHARADFAGVQLFRLLLGFTADLEIENFFFDFRLGHERDFNFRTDRFTHLPDGFVMYL